MKKKPLSLNISRNLSFTDSQALKEPGLKREINREMFAIIAPKYSLITQILSFGCDRYWKQALIKTLPDLAAPTCLDLACGPGDITQLLANRFTDAQVIGLDLCDNMLRLAQQKKTSTHLFYLLADMQTLPFPDHSFDIITGGYALRNAPDLNLLLKEVYRKLKPGGVAVFLDFSRPANSQKAARQARLLKFWTRLWGRIFHGNPEVYGYIAESLALFPNTEDLHHLILENGFNQFSRHEYLGGFTALLRFIKPQEFQDEKHFAELNSRE